jgi:signal transduction histidine kinase
MELSIVVDNLVDNARKARASKVMFRLQRLDRTILAMEVADDGRGLPSDVDEEDIFGLGFSRTSGSGLGLYHVRQILGEMGGTISAIPADVGAAFLVRFA